ncbi:MAG TPA: T9SS type A sorting domain-containing protein [Bacteroidales bacterium]|nr:T9SS type A sorting domain-containing protein [Bacteroidales bacterium]
MFPKTFSAVVLFICLFACTVFPQYFILSDSMQYPDRFVSKSLPMLTDKELMKIATLPDLIVPPDLVNKVTLPYKIDNSIQSYMIATTWQSGYECGQSASIANDFTYEINRLRNLPSNIPENRYVTHFAWNFLNNGHNYTGASYYDSWEIVRMCGTPNVEDYGGELYSGGEKRWMTGYDLYYDAMLNRLYAGYNIQVGTPEGLMILKNWLHNHLDGSAVGGLANFYAKYGSPDATLPAGTEEGGKALMSTWGTSPSHTWTIVGYNDSIRFDFNGDGFYTNTLDINYDGVVDMHDWETGGLKFVNGYAGPAWGNGGYCYMMYKALADDISSGGIWNHRVSIQYVKQEYNPLLTMKVGLQHDCRNKIKVTAGVSTNLSDIKPQYVLDFPIFNFQGGEYYMQGDSTEAAKSIEFGLDISPLLTYVQPGQNAKYFLQVAEKDPSGTYTGKIISYSMMDYTSGVVQIDCPSTNVNLINNDTTRLSVNRTVNYSRVGITTNSLPNGTINEPYAVQLNASNGTPDYHWDFAYDFSESYSGGISPAVTSIQLVANSTGYAVQNLSFDFPFYGEKYNKLYISPDGYIKFDDQVFTWPFLIDKVLLFKSTKMIAPFLADLVFGSGQGFWYEGNSQYAAFRWKAYVSGQSGSSVNVVVKLFPDGKFEMYYNNISVASTTGWISAVSRGNNNNYQFTSFSGKLNVNTVTRVAILTPPAIPVEMKISDGGLFYGTPVSEINNIPLTFKVTDNNNIESTKTLLFSSEGVLVAHSVSAGPDTIINAGETVLLSVALKNIGNNVFPNAQMKISSNDVHIILTDSIETAGNLAPDDSVAFQDAFSFLVDTAVSDNYLININLVLYNAADTFYYNLPLRVRSLILDIGAIGVADGNNNILEPGENASVLTDIINIGGTTAYHIAAILSSNDPYVSVISDSMYFSSLAGGDTSVGFYVIHIANTVPDGHLAVFNLKLSADGGYVTHKFFTIQIGGNAEDFETSDFSSFPWVATTTGDSAWFVSTQLPFEGSYCTKSGNISENQQTSLAVTLNILNSGTVSFYRKVSCEDHPGVTDYDFLAFFIDGIEKGRWDGQTAWIRSEYPVSAGIHTFIWTYKKDYSVSEGEDCAWLDYIVFPPSIETGSDVVQHPVSIFKEQEIESSATDSITFTNFSLTNPALYQCQITNFSANSTHTWLTPEVHYGCIDANSTGSLKLIFDSHSLLPDTYNCLVHLTYNFADSVSVPVTFQVVNTSRVDENTTLRFNLQASPNPFTHQTTISFILDQPSAISLSIFDLNGKKIKTLASGDFSAGIHKIIWDGTGENHQNTPSGIYYYRFIGEDAAISQRIILMK